MKTNPRMLAAVLAMTGIGLSGTTATTAPARKAPPMAKRKLEHVAGMEASLKKARDKRTRKATKRRKSKL
jgi:hypothetical protein